MWKQTHDLSTSHSEVTKSSQDHKLGFKVKVSYFMLLSFQKVNLFQISFPNCLPKSRCLLNKQTNKQTETWYFFSLCPIAKTGLFNQGRGDGDTRRNQRTKILCSVIRYRFSASAECWWNVWKWQLSLHDMSVCFIGGMEQFI